MPLPTWGETKPAFNKATRPLEVGKDVREKWSWVLVIMKDVRAKPQLTPAYILGLRPKASSRDS